MAADKTFLLPVVIDETREDDERVPDKFRDVYWTRLPGGETPPAFVERVLRLLSSAPSPAPILTQSYRVAERQAIHDTEARPRRPVRRRAVAAWAAFGALLLVGSYFIVRNDLLLRRSATLSSEGGEKSIAVLPFLDLSEKHDQEYFSDGLTEELIDRLAHSPDVKVIARTSAFAFKGKSEDARTIAAKLGVANLLEGSVRKSDNALRITAQLIRARDGAHLWSQSYDRGVANIFQIQEEIAAMVSSALQVALSGQGVRASAVVNPEAYNAFLRGKYFLERAEKDDIVRSLAALQEAIHLDPNYALAWVELGWVFNASPFSGRMTPQEAHSRALDAARKALTIDPQLAAAHFLLAGLAWNYDFDFRESRREYARALELDPQLDTLNFPIIVAVASGRTADAVIAAQRLAERDPLSVLIHRNLASALYNDTRFAEAEAAMRQVFDLSPLAVGNYAQLASILRARDQAEQALELLERETNEMYKQAGQVDVLWALGRRTESSAVLHTVEQRYGDKQAYSIAESYVFRGDFDAAFHWLDRAYENREPPLTLIRGDWDFRKLRGDPRYMPLLAKMHLDQ